MFLIYCIYGSLQINVPLAQTTWTISTSPYDFESLLCATFASCTPAYGLKYILYFNKKKAQTQ